MALFFKKVFICLFSELLEKVRSHLIFLFSGLGSIPPALNINVNQLLFMKVVFLLNTFLFSFHMVLFLFLKRFSYVYFANC
jgi:hypothetical protein